MQKKPVLFRLDDDILGSFTLEDVIATYDSMAEMELAKDPFPHYCIEFSTLFFDKFWLFYSEKEYRSEDDLELTKWEKKLNAKSTWILDFLWEGPEEDQGMHIKVRSKTGYEQYFFDVPESVLSQDARHDYMVVCWHIRAFLMVLLATKNVEKKTTINSPRSVSPRQKKDAQRYSSTVTIKIGQITETYRNNEDNTRNVRPHLRRGHIRTQRFGTGRTESKKIFIQPVFVNADEDWIAAQRTYKVVP